MRSAVPVEVKVSLQVGVATTSVTVESSAELVETDPTTHTDVDRNLFDKLPLESQSSSLSSLVTLASPGVAADSNGLFHGLGDHASNSFSIDGQPITDQQSKVFSNQLPVDAVQSMEVIEGAPPAEYGDKTSLVIVVTTRSGLGQTQPHGDITGSYGSFGTANGSANLGWGGEKWGNFISLSGLNTSRFLDGPEFTVMHDHGNQQNIFDRLDLKPSSKDTINLNLGFTRCWFQTPNSFDSQNATAWSGPVCVNYLSFSDACNGLGPNGQVVGRTDQVSKIRTFNIAPSWTRVINANTVFTFGGFARQDQFNYYPSADPFADLIPDLQTTTIGQNRRLTNLGLRTSLSMVKGKHNIKIGATYQDTILTENDTFGIVDPTFNPVCLNADGSPNLDPTLMNPANCGGAAFVNPGYDPLLACYDLTRTGPLPAGDGCPTARSAQYTFNGHANIRQLALYLQDTITLKNWTFNLGLRGEVYSGISSASQVEPRLGIAYNIKPTSTVLQVSYARTLETPFNENLVLASVGCNDPVINDLMATHPGLSMHDFAADSGLSERVPRRSPAGFRAVPGDQRRIHLEVHAQRLRLQRAGQHADHLSDRVGQFQNPRLRHPRQRAELPRLHGVRRDVQRGGALLRAASQRNRYHARRASARAAYSASTTTRTSTQTTHLQYQIGEERAVDQLQLALRQRPGCRSGAVRGRAIATTVRTGPTRLWTSPT